MLPALRDTEEASKRFADLGRLGRHVLLLY
jgi:hypothetical protein